MRQLIGQHLYIGVSGYSLTDSEKKFIVENNIGGIVLFERNLQSPQQIHQLCSEIQSLRHKMPDKSPIAIGIDMEGGRIARLKAPFTQWPPLKKLGDIDSPTMSFHFSYAMGKEMKSVGINLDFAPCIDVFNNPKNTVIGDRSISSDHEIVAKHASAIIRGYVKSEVIACAKHFPGHGYTVIDSHHDLPMEDLSLERITEIELNPFRKAFKSRVDMVMTAHILFKNIDAKWPVTLSEIFIKKMLREEMKYKGIVIADDLDMEALAKHYDKSVIPVQALKAGIDILLYCNEAESPARVIDRIEKALKDGELNKADLESTYKRLIEFKKAKIPNPDPLPFKEVASLIGHTDHFKLSQAISNGEIIKDLSMAAD